MDERYSGDLTDKQWQGVEPLIPAARPGGRNRSLDMRQVVNAIRFLEQTQCGWRNLPDGFPNWTSVRHYYDRWRRDGTWDKIQQTLRDFFSTENAACGLAQANWRTCAKPQAALSDSIKGAYPWNWHSLIWRR